MRLEALPRAYYHLPRGREEGKDISKLSGARLPHRADALSPLWSNGEPPDPSIALKMHMNVVPRLQMALILYTLDTEIHTHHDIILMFVHVLKSSTRLLLRQQRQQPFQRQRQQQLQQRTLLRHQSSMADKRLARMVQLCVATQEREAVKEAERKNIEAAQRVK